MENTSAQIDKQGHMGSQPVTESLVEQLDAIVALKGTLQ